jgi:hypothetical protein
VDQRFFESFTLNTDLFLGQRAGGVVSDTGFVGSVAGLKIYSSPLLQAEARCVFHAADQVLQDVLGGGH